MNPGKRVRKLRETAGDLRAARPLADAVAMVKDAANAKFDETVEAALRLGVDPRKSEQAVRGAVMLPAGSGRTVRVAVAADEADAAAALAAGADRAGLADLIEEIKSGEINFDVLIAAPAAMRSLAPLGRVLGPRGLMPNPKSGTVAADVAAAVARAKSGQVGYRADRAAVVHAAVGKASFAADDLLRNVAALIDSVKKAKPAASKGVYLRRLSIASTMGIGVRVDLAPYR